VAARKAGRIKKGQKIWFCINMESGASASQPGWEFLCLARGSGGLEIEKTRQEKEHPD